LGALTRVVRPWNCLMAFGVPTTMEEFESDLALGRNDFARQIGDPRTFKTAFLKDFRTTTSTMRKLGLYVKQNATVQALADAFTLGFPVTILYSHWNLTTGCIELRDGLQSPQTITEIVPRSYSGLIDLTVCTPPALAKQLFRAREELYVMWNENELDARFWLWFYVALFKLLSENEMTYLDGFEKVTSDFRSIATRR
jgi:hypothetical protein